MKRKLLMTVLGIIMAVSLVFGLTACGEEEVPAPVTYTVTFDVQGHGTAPSAQTVEEGAKATDPGTLSAEGWVFGGWYKETGCTNAFDFTAAINANTTVYAKWTAEVKTPDEGEEKDDDSDGEDKDNEEEEGGEDDGNQTETPATYTVTFNVQGHGTAPAAQSITSGGHATDPGTLTAEGWIFEGWYKTANGSEEFDFDSEVITEPVTVYAHWTEKTTSGEDTSVDTSTKFTGKIYLVGDSTVCSFSDAYYLPRYGYGTQIYNYINMDADNVVNLALSGRSSYSFITESNYNTLVDSIGSGDYLLIGFGHNDEKREISRYTDPTLAYTNDATMIGSYDAQRTVSFKAVLYNYYIKVAKDAGATPILCTPISRLFIDSKVSSYDTDHTTTTASATDSTSGVTTTFTGGDYAQAIRDLGEELGLNVIDLTTITRADYKAKGYDEASKYHAATGAKWVDDAKTIMEPASIDGTHTNLYGAMMNAYYIASAIKASNLPLAANVKTNITAPTYEDNIGAAINPNYTIPDKESFNPETDKSANWTAVTGYTTDETTGDQYNWYGTVFGANAGSSSIKNYSITQSTSDGLSFTLSTEKGKLQSSDDNILAVFIQVPFETALTMTATANVTAYTGSQAGFGIMIRDDIYIDDFTAVVSSNYVTAGTYSSSSKTYMGYARLDGSLATNQSISGTLPLDSYDLSLARTSQSIVGKVGTYSYNAVSDFDLRVSDSEYVYVCLWVARATVTFSNINLTTSEWVSA